MKKQKAEARQYRWKVAIQARIDKFWFKKNHNMDKFLPLTVRLLSTKATRQNFPQI